MWPAARAPPCPKRRRRRQVGLQRAPLATSRSSREKKILPEIFVSNPTAGRSRNPLAGVLIQRIASYRNRMFARQARGLWWLPSEEANRGFLPADPLIHGDHLNFHPIPSALICARSASMSMSAPLRSTCQKVQPLQASRSEEHTSQL